MSALAHLACSCLHTTHGVVRDALADASVFTILNTQNSLFFRCNHLILLKSETKGGGGTAASVLGRRSSSLLLYPGETV